jgi:hypothetical protein
MRGRGFRQDSHRRWMWGCDDSYRFTSLVTETRRRNGLRLGRPAPSRAQKRSCHLQPVSASLRYATIRVRLPSVRPSVRGARDSRPSGWVSRVPFGRSREAHLDLWRTHHGHSHDKRSARALQLSTTRQAGRLLNACPGPSLTRDVVDVCPASTPRRAAYPSCRRRGERHSRAPVLVRGLRDGSCGKRA